MRVDHTTTPLQALASMNNIAFVEAARFLAERVLRAKGLKHPERIERAFRLVVSRAPRPEESRILMADLRYYLQEFKGKRATAKRLLAVGEKPHGKTVNPVQLAAYTLIANTIFNLDEAISQN